MWDDWFLGTRTLTSSAPAMFPIEELIEVIRKRRWNSAPANKHEAVHFKFSRPTSVVISWILSVTNEGGAVPVSSDWDRKSVFIA